MLYSNFEQKEMQSQKGNSYDIVKGVASELKRENEELRLQLNTLKLKVVSAQQTEFNTAIQHP